jgi:uncharacterized membrane protein YdjX (TVP38/TMEM64 family)
MHKVATSRSSNWLFIEIVGVPLYRWLLLCGIVLGLVGVSMVIRTQLRIDWNLDSLRAFVQGLGIWGALAFIGILTFRFLFLIPTGLLLLAGGAIFGPVYGTLYAGLGMFLSGMLKFGLVAILGRDKVLSTLPPKVQSWVRKLAQGRMSAWALFGICAYPFFPKHVFQYAAILSGMSLLRFIVAVLFGCMVQAFLFANIGQALYSGAGIALSSSILLISILVPLCVPAWRRWMLASLQPKTDTEKPK